MAISKILAPLFDREEDTATLSLAAEIAMYFHAHVEVAGASLRSTDRGQDETQGSLRGDVSSGPTGRHDLRAVFERWRRQHRLELQPECIHRSLASTSWLSLEDRGELRVSQRARLADLVCLAARPGEAERGDWGLHEVLFSSGLPVLIHPVGNNVSGTPIMGEPIIIGWNGSIEAVHAVMGALPLIKTSRHVQILSIGEESVNAFDAYELAKYLAWCGVRAAAMGIAVKDWIGEDVIDAALDKGAKLLVMGARQSGNATNHMLKSLPLPALMAA